MSESFVSAEAFHPGGFLRKELEARNLDATEFAQSIGLSPAQVKAICDEQEPMTVTVAERVSRAFGTSCTLWINLQCSYSIAQIASIRRDLIAWASLHGELDAVWVQTDLEQNEQDMRYVKQVAASLKATAQRIDRDRGI